MRSYQAARNYFSILGIISWTVIVVGGLVALVGLAALGDFSRELGGSSLNGLAGVVPGISVSFIGFMGLVLVQIGRAGVDTAEYSQQMLQVARDQLEVSRETAQRGQKISTSFSSAMAEEIEPSKPSFAEAAHEGIDAGETPSSKQGDPNLIHYRGRTIEKRDGKYFVEGKSYLNQKYAELRINDLNKGKT